MELNVGFSGTREGMTYKQRITLQQRLYEIAGGYNNLANIQSFHHGVSGESDKFAHYTARALSFYIIGHPCIEPELQQYRFACICDEMRDMEPALDRNQTIIDEIGSPKPEMGLLLATPKTDVKSRSGTWSALLRAYKAGVPFEIIQRNGESRYEI